VVVPRPPLSVSVRDAPIKTGTVWGMKVPDEDGLADHLGSESCAGVGNGVGDAWTGGWAGRVWSLDRRAKLPGADAVLTRGRPHGVPRDGEGHLDLAGSKTPGRPRHTVHGHRESRCRPAPRAGRRGTSQDGRHGCTDTGSRMGASDQRSPRARRQAWRGGREGHQARGMRPSPPCPGRRARQRAGSRRGSADGRR
jgi:hypothetical protein